MKKLFLTLTAMTSVIITVYGATESDQQFGSDCCATSAACKKPGVACTMECRLGTIDGDSECIAVGDPCNAQQDKTKSPLKGRMVMRNNKAVCLPIPRTYQKSGQKFGTQCCGTPAECRKPGVMCTKECRMGAIDGNGGCVAVGDACNAQKDKNTRSSIEGHVVIKNGKAVCVPHLAH